MSDNSQKQATIKLATEDFKITVSTVGPEATLDAERLLSKVFEWLDLEDEDED